jgi:hypothetical protein
MWQENLISAYGKTSKGKVLEEDVTSDFVNVLIFWDEMPGP